MRELQPIGHRSFVALCYRHLPPLNRKGITSLVTEPGSASGGSTARRSAIDSESPRDEPTRSVRRH